MKDAPGMRWVLILGASGFAAGFLGPMVFVPEANQGPLVGIFISGPAGTALGFVLYGICALFKVSAQKQWRLLSGTAAVGVVTILLIVQPQPALRGTLYDTAVKSCASPVETEAAIFGMWEKQIAEVTWATPRAGWREDMHATLERAPGVVVTAEILQANSVFENRKPWNRGTIFADGWTKKSGETSFYYPEGSCGDFPVGRESRGFRPYDLNGKIEPPKDWPPKELERVIRVSTMSAVPEAYKTY
jgi:hypothetical protein